MGWKSPSDRALAVREDTGTGQSDWLCHRLFDLSLISPVLSPKKPSPSAARTKKTLEGAPVHSFQTLLADLSTIVRNSITPNLEGAPAWQQETEPSALQQRAFDLLKNIAAP